MAFASTLQQGMLSSACGNSYTQRYLSGRRALSVQARQSGSRGSGSGSSSSSSRSGSSSRGTTESVGYGADWYRQTREATSRRSEREELQRRRQANREANNGMERKDLYTENWDGWIWKGSKFNILGVIIALFFLTPVAGLVFAYATYGQLWG